MRSYKETFRRALRTFFQAALGYIVTNVTLITMGYESLTDQKTALIGLLTAAIAAGAAAVMNLPSGDEEEADG